MRSCYSAKCRFFSDDSATDNRINWFFVPDSTPVYEEPHVFWPRRDDDDTLGRSPHENTLGGERARKWRNGANLWDAWGEHVHGDAADFMGESLRAKYYVGGEHPESPCGGVVRFQVKFGMRWKFRPVVAELLTAGVKIATRSENVVETLAIGISFATSSAGKPPAFFLQTGFEVGTIASTMPAGGELLELGFEVGTELISV